MRILFFLLFICFYGGVIAKTIEVCPTCPHKSINSAIISADKNDVVLVKKGVYKEFEIIIDKPLTLKGEQGAVIDGDNQGEIIIVESPGVTIDGFEIRNVGTSNLRDFSAVRIKEQTNFLVQNLTIHKPFFAIYLEKSNNGVVRNNKIYGEAVGEFGFANGIQLWYSHENLIEGNEVHQMRDGIYCEFSDRNIFKNNFVEKNARYGLHFMFCHDNAVLNSTYKSNGAGIAIMFSKRTNAHNNTFADNWGGSSYGILLKECYDSEFSHNLFKRNTVGINIEGSSRMKYYNNDFQSNGWAIRSRGANYENIFEKNNFLDNSFDLSYYGQINRNSFDGNYWSDYSGYDLDRDGIGDIPYRPIKLFSYLVNKAPQAIILLRSLFIDIIDFSEKVSPVFVPDNLVDEKPVMKMIKHDRN
ncbi:MAG: nitrous oxide reductase family maturation protein NosD [Brumimicrobium sp.]